MADTALKTPFRAAYTRQGIVKTTLAVLIAVGLLAALAAIQILHDGQQRIAYQDALERSVSERTQVQRIFSDLQQAESAQRGFIVTGDAAFVARYEAAAEAVPGHIDTLLELVAGTEQRERALRLKDLASRRLAYLEQGMDQRQAGGFDAVFDIMGPRAGHQAMDEFRQLVEEMTELEGGLIDSISSAARQQAASAQTIAILLIGSVLAVVITASLIGVAYLERRRRAEQDMRVLQHRAEHANRSKSEFLASMSHEVRTPLSGILGYADLLLKEALPPKHRRYVERIQVAGISLLTIVNEVLDFSGLEAGAPRLRRHPFAVRSLTDDVISILAPQAESQGIPIHVHIGPDVPAVVVSDEARLRQVLLNLTNNSLKFTERGHVTLGIEVDGHEGEAVLLRFTVSDTGVGIPSAQQGGLFKRFSQIGVATRRHGSTGLGLAICKQIVDLMGGRIGVESEQGRGATFWFVVRLAIANEGALDSTEEATFEPGPSRRVLVVEDLEQNREVVVAMLTAAGHEVHAVGDGAEAVRAAAVGRFDLVLMDIQMPGMSGIEAARKIRALSHPYSAVPILALSANALPHQVSACKAAGINGHMGKPFKRRELLAEVKRWGQMTADRQARETAAPGTAAEESETAELLDLMGQEWVERGLDTLRTKLNETFGESDVEYRGRRTLAGQAHTLVPLSAMLGFQALSKACAELERATRSERDITETIDRARSEARTAMGRIDALLADPGTPTVPALADRGHAKDMLGNAAGAGPALAGLRSRNSHRLDHS